MTVCVSQQIRDLAFVTACIVCTVGLLACVSSPLSSSSVHPVHVSLLHESPASQLPLHVPHTRSKSSSNAEGEIIHSRNPSSRDQDFERILDVLTEAKISLARAHLESQPCSSRFWCIRVVSATNLGYGAVVRDKSGESYLFSMTSRMLALNCATKRTELRYTVSFCAETCRPLPLTHPMLQPTYSSVDPSSEKRFLKYSSLAAGEHNPAEDPVAEAGHLARLHGHPSCLQMVECIMSPDRDDVFLVTELQTTSFIQLLSDLYRAAKLWSVDQGLRWFVQIVRAVEFLHSRGLAHLDIKPDNVLVAANGTLKLCDMGSAQDLVHAMTPEISTSITCRKHKREGTKAGDESKCDALGEHRLAALNEALRGSRDEAAAANASFQLEQAIAKATSAIIHDLQDKGTLACACAPMLPCTGEPGTEKYRDPAMPGGSRGYDGRAADVYSLGATLFLLVRFSCF